MPISRLSLSIQSGQDHADFLRKRERYAPFRAAMTDAIQGAWGLWRSGYATDPRHAPQRIDLVLRNNRLELDQGEP